MRSRLPENGDELTWCGLCSCGRKWDVIGWREHVTTSESRTPLLSLEMFGVLSKVQDNSVWISSGLLFAMPNHYIGEARGTWMLKMMTEDGLEPNVFMNSKAIKSDYLPPNATK
jgi:hypothetical protein